ncbi:hypothetical protein [Rhodoblastus sp.]|uniref:hypothetical protein n=1 Tax=Rhodoblastus sp. TaxID=1962975 RepID=UPI003F962783
MSDAGSKKPPRRDIERQIDEFGREVGADLLIAALLALAPNVNPEAVHATLVAQLDEKLKISTVSPRARKAAMSIIDRLLAP